MINNTPEEKEILLQALKGLLEGKEKKEMKPVDLSSTYSVKDMGINDYLHGKGEYKQELQRSKGINTGIPNPNTEFTYTWDTSSREMALQSVASKVQAKKVALLALELARKIAPKKSGRLARSHAIIDTGSSYVLYNYTDYAKYVSGRMSSKGVASGATSFVQKDWITKAKEQAYNIVYNEYYGW